MIGSISELLGFKKTGKKIHRYPNGTPFFNHLGIHVSFVPMAGTHRLPAIVLTAKHSAQAEAEITIEVETMDEIIDFALAIIELAKEGRAVL